MSFNYYRIFIVLLASFAAFFVYICRLNLSLTIDEMVVLDDTQGKDVEYFRYDTQDKSYETRHPLTSIDQTYAWYSHSWRREINYCRLKSLKANGTLLKKLANNRIPTFSLDVSNPDGVATGETGSLSTENPITGDDIDAHKNELHWSEADKNQLLRAFFIGYVVAQVPCARFEEIFGAKWMLLVSGLGGSLCSFAFPFAARYSDGITLAYIVRLILGATQAALFPASYVLLCEWLPKSERSKWLPYPSAFSRFGIIVMNLSLPGILYTYSWETVFYISGATTLIWTISFLIFGSSSPASSWWISKDELFYIESNQEPRIGTINPTQPSKISASGFTINESAKDINTKKQPVDWWKIISNKAILIMSVVMFSSEWSNMILLVKLPGFLKPVLNMDLYEIGLWNSILVAIYCVQYPLSGYCASRLENMKGISSLTVRKMFEGASHVMQGVSCIVIAYNQDKTVVLAALSLMMLGRSTVGGGQCLMPPELSKDYPGIVFAYANSLANVAGVIGPPTVTWMVSDTTDHSAWSNLFLLSAAIFFLCGLIFCIWGENQAQDYCRNRGFKDKTGSLSQACLTLDKAREQDAEKVFKMDAFQRLGKEPSKADVQL